MGRADENIFRMYLDVVRKLSESKTYDVYDTLHAYQMKLDALSDTSATAQRYRELVKDILKTDPRRQLRLSL